MLGVATQDTKFLGRQSAVLLLGNSTAVTDKVHIDTPRHIITRNYNNQTIGGPPPPPQGALLRFVFQPAKVRSLIVFDLNLFCMICFGVDYRFLLEFYDRISPVTKTRATGPNDCQ